MRVAGEMIDLSFVDLLTTDNSNIGMSHQWLTSVVKDLLSKVNGLLY